jgi:hypothetical protein
MVVEKISRRWWRIGLFNRGIGNSFSILHCLGCLKFRENLSLVEKSDFEDLSWPVEVPQPSDTWDVDHHLRDSESEPMDPPNW